MTYHDYAFSYNDPKTSELLSVLYIVASAHNIKSDEEVNEGTSGHFTQS